MIYQKQSRYSVDEVDGPLRAAAARHKFGVLNVLDLRATLRNKGMDLGHEARVYDICNPQAAAQALGENPVVATLLPCRIAVSSSGEGSVIAMVHPTDLFAASGLETTGSLAADVERELVAMIDEAAVSS
ncbi:MAG: DUF302 domain-containing protein [Alphaproteobacteria bacterium]|nr:DUF302 domain-containing protein [Alphaproteobacteria bacterium]